MRIEVWSDVVCPWCYIGKRRLEVALDSFEHADEVEVLFRSFELDPTAPEKGTESVAEVLGRKYGGGVEAGRQMIERTTEVAAAEGLSYDYADAVHTRTTDAHRLLHLALDTGGPDLQGKVKEALLAAYFTRGESMGDPDVLRRVAFEAGVDASRVDEVLSSDLYAGAVQADVDQARGFGANGVPFFVIDRKYGISGAQPSPVFGEALDRAWADSRPEITVVGSDEDAACS